MAKGILLFAVWFLAMSLSANAADRLADIPRLKAFAAVTGEVVRIGDLVENAGSAADVAIFRSPDIGGTGSISAAKVLEAVGQQGLLIVDAAGIDRIEVRRESRVISVREIEQRIARALSGQPGLSDPDKLTVTFDREARPIYVEPGVKAEPEVTRAIYDPRSSRFDVTLNVPGSAAARSMPLRFIGIIREIVDVPMLNRAINRGEIIKAADVVIERKARADVPLDAIVVPGTITGLAARQALRPGVSLRRTDVVRPEIVKRDELVTITYEVPGILLTSRGKAMEGGAEGDVINVINTQSRRVVQGAISGPGRVTIAAAIPAAVVNTASVLPDNTADSGE